MSATDELRRLLDERGVEWTAIHDTCTSWMMPVGNQLQDGFRVPVRYDGTLHVECVMSPTQAIAATLGNDGVRGTNDGVDECDQLKAENKKLRELIKFAYDCATSGVSCRDCDLAFGKGNCQLKADLKSAGIEVGK